MHPSRRLAISATLAIIFLMIISSKSDDEMISEREKQMMRKRLVLGSRPPTCVGKCMSCKPCIATLVVPPRRQNKASIMPSSTLSYGYGGNNNNHDSYYLLSWKCKCGNKLFQP